MKFWKMHGLGNDYIVIDNRDGKISSARAAALAKALCERRFSVGADGLLLVCVSEMADARMRIFNADGSEAEMCGNGIRCFAKYCYENGVARKTELTVETLAGIKRTWLTVESGVVTSVKVDMGKPALERSRIPMLGQGQCINEDLQVNGSNYKVTCLSVGNPHCVIFVDNVDAFPVQQIGPKIENHTVFPKRTNVEFAQVLSTSEVKVRVWERGCGETF
ncbi:MAG: diaminopimelate epimerase, partial [Candidatus Bathyarchaeales archaeon]